jgi:hypothetical protein
MRTRSQWCFCFVGSLGLAGSCAAQDAFVQISLAWRETYAGTVMPVANPNGLLEPGESALFDFTIRFTPVGTLVPHMWGGYGHVLGLGFALIRLFSHGGAEGTWSHYYVAPPFHSIQIADPDGTLFADIGQGAAWPVIDPRNPVIWTALWTPDSYDIRNVDFYLVPPHGFPARLRVADEINPLSIADALAVTIPDAIQIGVVPAPGAAAVCGLAAFLACRRRRSAAQPPVP